MTDDEPRERARSVGGKGGILRGSLVSSLSIELTDPSSSCEASRPFSADSLRIMILIARILGELEPSVAADDDDGFEVLACFLVHFSPKGD